MTRLGPVLEEIAASQPDLGPFVIQHGSMALPKNWEGAPMFAGGDLVQLVRNARIVITHGGPATIAEARRWSKVPVVIPRQSAFGEHVDDHQLRYAERLNRAKEVILVTQLTSLPPVVRDYDRLISSLPPAEAHDPRPAVAKFQQLLAGLELHASR